MHRIDSSTVEADLFGAGKDGYTAGDPALNIPATQTTPDHFNTFQEELAGLVEDSGQELIKADNTQVLRALQRLIRRSCATNWFERVTGIAVALECIASDGLGNFVAVGAATGGAAQILTSPDGFTWTVRTNAANVQLNGVVWSSSLALWVVVGNTETGAGRIFTSPDGVTWTARASGVNRNLNSVAVTSGGVLVAVGDHGTILRSVDGTTWTNPASGHTTDFYAVAWNGTIFCIVGSTSGTMITSPDGTTWTDRFSLIVQAHRGIVWNGSCWIAVGELGAVTTSEDSINWTTTYLPSAGDLKSVAVAADGLVVLVGAAGRVAVSRAPLALAWTELVAPTASNLRGIAWTTTQGGFWIATQASGKVLHSLHTL